MCGYTVSAVWKWYPAYENWLTEHRPLLLGGITHPHSHVPCTHTANWKESDQLRNVQKWLNTHLKGTWWPNTAESQLPGRPLASGCWIPCKNKYTTEYQLIIQIIKTLMLLGDWKQHEQNTNVQPLPLLSQSQTILQSPAVVKQPEPNMQLPQ